MTEQKKAAHPERIKDRRDTEGLNPFSRLPAIYSASRSQAQRFLKLAGGLSIVEWRTLWDLAEAGPMTIRDLAAIQRSDHSLISRALPAMRRKGYVTMVQDSQDKRQTLVHLTAEGRAAYDRAAPIMARRRAALRDAMSEDDIRRLIDLLNRLEEFLNVPADDILELETSS